MKKLLSLAAIALSAIVAMGQTSTKLSGTVIGTELSVDYNTNRSSTTVNTRYEAFDGNINTCFAAYQRSFGWAGLELDSQYVITRVGWSPRNEDIGPGRMVLGVFQGANNPDFSDALPIYMITESTPKGQMAYADVSCSKGFKYVRYVGPNDARCNVAELEFYGYEGAGDENALFQPTNLPLVVVNTPNMQWFTSDKSYEMNGSSITVIKDGKVDVSAPGQIRGRGNASWDFPKKPFRIKFDKKQTVLGGPAKAKKWTMINNYGDKTLMRNKLAFDISRMVGMKWTPVCHFVDLIFNGEYQGTYQLCDQIEVNANRVNITEMEATDTEGEALTGGYLCEIDAYASQEPADEWFKSQGIYQLPVTIKSPDPGVTEQYNYIRNRFTMLDNAISASNFASENGYRRLLDLDSFLNYLIVNEMAGNIDAFWSTYVTLERGEDKMVVGPVWDFDLGFDNVQRVWPINSTQSTFITANGSYAGGMKNLTQRIINQDAGARERLKYLWSNARVNLGITPETMVALVNLYEQELEQSAALNFKRWPIMNTLVHQNPRIFGSYAAEVDNVRSYISGRPGRLDEIIGRVEVASINTIDIPAAKVTPIAGGIAITGANTYTVYNLQGITLHHGTGDATIHLPKGLYIITADGISTKHLVR